MSFWKIFKKCFGYGDKVTLVYFDLEGMLTDEGAVQEVMKSIPNQKYDDPDFDFYNYFDDPKSDKGENEAKLDQPIQSLTLAYRMKELIETLHQQGNKLIVISDYVDIVIEKFLESQGLRQYFADVYAPEAKFNSRDVLQIKTSYRGCSLAHWKRVVALVGETGRSNLLLKDLKKGDLVCIRKGSELFQLFQEDYEKRKSVWATFFKYSTGLEILKELEHREDESKD
jgi:hypothetical protein